MWRDKWWDFCFCKFSKNHCVSRPETSCGKWKIVSHCLLLYDVFCSRIDFRYWFLTSLSQCKESWPNISAICRLISGFSQKAQIYDVINPLSKSAKYLDFAISHTFWTILKIGIRSFAWSNNTLSTYTDCVNGLSVWPFWLSIYFDQHLYTLFYDIDFLLKSRLKMLGKKNRKKNRVHDHFRYLLFIYVNLIK